MIGTRPSSRLPLAPTAPSERRDHVARRLKTFLPTSLRTVNGVRRAHILNISRTGAKLHAQQPVEAGQMVEIAIGDDWLGGCVRWRRGETFGVAFHEPVPDDVLQGFLATR